MSKLNEMTDEELALAYVGGDNRAFDLLLSRNEVKLFSYILFVVHDEDLANDIFQETFVKAISRLHAGQYSSSGKFISWLMRIAHNVIIDGFFVMLHHNQGIAQVTQVLQGCQQPVVVPLVQTDTGLIQDVTYAHQSGANLSCQTDTLGFTAGQCPCGAG